MLGKEYDHRVDIWSFGVVSYYLHYAFLPFDDNNNNMNAIIKKIASGEVKFIDTCDSSFNSHELEIKSVIKSCLTVNPTKRIKIDEILDCKFLSQNFI
jgi:serine/threonine protein kinase